MSLSLSIMQKLSKTYKNHLVSLRKLFELIACFIEKKSLRFKNKIKSQILGIIILKLMQSDSS